MSYQPTRASAGCTLAPCEGCGKPEHRKKGTLCNECRQKMAKYEQPSRKCLYCERDMIPGSECLSKAQSESCGLLQRDAQQGVAPHYDGVTTHPEFGAAPTQAPQQPVAAGVKGLDHG